MFKSVEMSFIHLFVKGSDNEKVTSILYDLKLIELLNVEHENFVKYDVDNSQDKTAYLLDLRSAISILKRYYTEDTFAHFDDAIEKTKDWMSKLDATNTKILHLEDEIKRKRILDNLKVKKEELNNPKTTIGFISLDSKSNLKVLGKEGVNYRTYKGYNRLYFITQVSKKKITFGFKEFYLPKDIEKNLKIKLQHERDKIEKIESSLRRIANGNLNLLEIQERKIAKEISLNEAKHKFTKTNNVSVITGFVPSKKVSKLQERLEDEIEDSFELVEDKSREDAPIELRNKGLSKSFESLLEMYTLPNYKEIDPTFVMFLVFPIFYGFILGDFGYGLLTFLLFTLLKPKFPDLRPFFNVLQLSAVSSMIFGIIYGEYFGFEPHLLPFEFHRANYPETLLLYAVIFGLAHINLGLIIGFFNNLKTSFKKGLYDNLSWIFLQIGLGIVAYGFSINMLYLKIVGGLIALLSAVLIYLGHGFIGIIEIPSFFTNILSYARLMAVGLSSIAIAVLVNEYSVPLIQSGVLGAVFGIALFTLGHAFNILLGNFESFLHTLRLHYVEFFTKFYTGGGRKFKPFGERE